MITKPMLAIEAKDVNELDWPMIATPKIDGIRCINPDGRILTRSFKPVPNDHIRHILSKFMPIGADGELLSGDSFQKVTSSVMTKTGEPDFQLCMFDYVKNDLKKPYADRLMDMTKWSLKRSKISRKYIKLLQWQVIYSLREFKVYEEKMLECGFEGVILRVPEGPYKCGRSTWKERYLIKVKPFVDSEAVILGFLEQMSNCNILEKDELGYAKRSSAKSGKLPADTLGKFLVRDVYSGVGFKIGTGQGMTHELRKQIWHNKSDYIGKIIKYKCQKIGVKDKPRIPIFLGFRDEKDVD